MSRVSKLKAELAMAEAEEAFVDLKAEYKSGAISEEDYRAAKVAVRELRQDYRENYRKVVPGATPDPVAVKVDG